MQRHWIKHIENKNVTWEKCSLRQWLNSSFYNECFSVEEKKIIKDTIIFNEDNYKYGTAGGNITVDKIFLLSIDEVELYFIDDNDRCVDSWWWLRSPGENLCYAADVDYDGTIVSNGDSVNDEEGGVRPALYLKF